MSTEKLLKLDGVKVQYGGIRALDGASVGLSAGEVVALMGPNGAGKSTVLKAIFGLAPISGGSVSLHGHDIKPVSHEIVHEGIAFVPQGRRVFTHLTVEENLEIGAYIEKNKDVIKRRMEEVMEIFPVLRQKRKAKSGTLSGGQQQMLAIGRGLMADPKILLLDEPTLGLSPKLVKEMFAKIKEINERHGTSIFVVEHNIQSILDIVHRAYLLDKGKVVAEGHPGELVESGVLEKVFMGKM